MFGGNHSVGKRLGLSLATTLALAVAFSGTDSAWPAQLSTPKQLSTELKVELNGTTDSAKAANSLALRRDHIKQLLEKLSQTNRIKEKESLSFGTQIDSISNKLDTAGSGAMASLVDLAQQLDSLMYRIAKAANLASFPSLVSVDSFDQSRELVADAQKDEERFDIVCVSRAELQALIDARRAALDNATSSDSNSPRADSRLTHELARLDLLNKGLASVESDQLVIPVAVENDLLGNRIVGVVRSYELRPMVDADQSSTPTASLSTFSNDVADQISQIETRLQREVLTERITEDEAQVVGEGLKSIVSLEKEYRSDGQLTETELARLSSALYRLNSRLNRSVAVK